MISAVTFVVPDVRVRPHARSPQWLYASEETNGARKHHITIPWPLDYFTLSHLSLVLMLYRISLYCWHDPVHAGGTAAVVRRQTS